MFSGVDSPLVPVWCFLSPLPPARRAGRLSLRISLRISQNWCRWPSSKWVWLDWWWEWGVEPCQGWGSLSSHGKGSKASLGQRLPDQIKRWMTLSDSGEKITSLLRKLWRWFFPQEMLWFYGVSFDFQLKVMHLREHLRDYVADINRYPTMNFIHMNRCED